MGRLGVYTLQYYPSPPYRIEGRMEKIKIRLWLRDYVKKKDVVKIIKKVILENKTVNKAIKEVQCSNISMSR